MKHRTTSSLLTMKIFSTASIPRRNFPPLRMLALGLASIVTSVLAVTANAQSTLLGFQGFEGTTADNWTYTNTGGAASNTTGSTDTPANQRIATGSYSFQVNNATSTATFSNFSLADTNGAAAYNGVYISLRLTSTSGNTTNGSDAGDYVRAFVALNGATLATNSAANADISLTGNSNARWGYNATQIATTTAGTNLTVTSTQGTSTANYSTFLINIPDGTTSASFRLNLLNNDANEIWNIDNVSIYGTPVPEPATIFGGLLLVGALSWNQRRRLGGLVGLMRFARAA